jgi:hypothetical protein
MAGQVEEQILEIGLPDLDPIQVFNTRRESIINPS